VLLLTLLLSPGAGAAGFGAAWPPAGSAATVHQSRAAETQVDRGVRPTAARPAPAPLVASGTIEGKVTDAVSTNGLQGIEVCALPLEETEEEENEELFFHCQTTGAQGAYTITSLTPGRYVVEFVQPFNSKLN
jgi:hypothetical protein